VPKDRHEKEMQRALMQYFMPQYREKARQALIKANREDLIGTGKNCLVPPRREERSAVGKKPPLRKGEKLHPKKQEKKPVQRKKRTR